MKWAFWDGMKAPNRPEMFNVAYGCEKGGAIESSSETGKFHLSTCFDPWEYLGGSKVAMVISI